LKFSTGIILLDSNSDPKMFIFSIYCPPDNIRKKQALLELNQLIDIINKSYANPKILIAGDFNLDLTTYKLSTKLNLDKVSYKILTRRDGRGTFINHTSK